MVEQVFIHRMKFFYFPLMDIWFFFAGILVVEKFFQFSRKFSKGYEKL